MKGVPFYANSPDDMGCMVAALRSTLEYITSESYTWDEIADILGYTPGKAAWTVKAWTQLARQGFDIRMVEKFDYKRFQYEGEDYLRATLRPEEFAWQLKNSNVMDIRALIPEFYETVHHVQRSPALGDIDDMLQNGYIVLVQLNSRILNGKDGFVAHMITIYDTYGDAYIAHDPGLPPIPERKISRELLLRAMGGRDNTTEVTGIRRP